MAYDFWHGLAQKRSFLKKKALIKCRRFIVTNKVIWRRARFKQILNSLKVLLLNLGEMVNKIRLFPEFFIYIEDLFGKDRATISSWVHG